MIKTIKNIKRSKTPEQLVEVYVRLDAHKGVLKLRISNTEKRELEKLKEEVDEVVSRYALKLANIKNDQTNRF